MATEMTGEDLLGWRAFFQLEYGLGREAAAASLAEPPLDVPDAGPPLPGGRRELTEAGFDALMRAHVAHQGRIARGG